METEAQGMRIPDLMPERGFPGNGADQLTQVVLKELAESGLGEGCQNSCSGCLGSEDPLL